MHSQLNHNLLLEVFRHKIGPNWPNRRGKTTKTWHLFLSVYFRVSLFLSVSIWFCLFLSVSDSFCLFLFVSVFFLLPVSVHCCLIMSGSVCFSVFVSVCVCLCLFASAFVGFYRFLSVSVNFWLFCQFLSFWEKINNCCCNPTMYWDSVSPICRIFYTPLGKPLKNTIESVSMLIPSPYCERLR